MKFETVFRLATAVLLVALAVSNHNHLELIQAHTDLIETQQTQIERLNRRIDNERCEGALGAGSTANFNRNYSTITVR